jgi:hypothetical protein
MSAVFLLPIPTSLCAKVGILFEYSRPPPRGLFCAHQQEDPPCDHLQVHRGPLQATHIRPTYPTVKELVDRLITAYTEPGQPYNWQDYGYVILIEESDVNGTLDEVREGCRLVDIPWEGIMLRDGFFIAIYLANNEYGLIFVIPDALWVNGDLRRLIEGTLDPLPVNQPTKEARQ